MTEVLGEGVFDLVGDNEDLKRVFRETRTDSRDTTAEVDRNLEKIKQDLRETGRSAQTSFQTPMLQALSAVGFGVKELESAFKELERSGSDLETQLALMPAEAAAAAREFHKTALEGEQLALSLEGAAGAFEDLGSSAVGSTALVVSALHEQENAVEDLIHAYERLALVRAISAGPGGPLSFRPAGLPEAYGPTRGPAGPAGFITSAGRDGSPARPYVMVLEAAQYGGLPQSMAAAIGTQRALGSAERPALPAAAETHRDVIPLGADSSLVDALRGAFPTTRERVQAGRAVAPDPLAEQLKSIFGTTGAEAARSAVEADRASAATERASMSTMDAARKLDVSTSKIYDLLARGRLAGEKGPAGWQIDPASVSHLAADGGGGMAGAAAGGAAGGGRGGGVPPWLTALLWGRGGGGGGGGGRGLPLGLRALGGFGIGAGLGSLGAFAGLGPEHIVMTAAGIAGSAATGAAGGGLLGLGALGSLAVGGGADAGVMKSTIADTQTLVQGYNQLENAVALYGKNSRQAAVAQAQLNQNIKLLSAGTAGQGVQAEMKLAQAARALGTQFDAATQQARVQAVNILEQIVQLGSAYVPKVAEAAQRNLSIINQGIKPLFSWLEGPTGMAIWNNLENNFAKNLPNAVHAFNQSLELVLRVTSIASNYTGGFTKELDKLATRANSLSDQRLTVWIEHMIGQFRLWEQFVKALGTDLYLLFKQDAQTGSSIIATLTEMLNKLGAWERSTRGSAQLHNIFEVHKQEVLALLSLLPAIVSGFGSIYMHLAPVLTQALTTVIEAISTIVTGISKLSPLAGSLLGLALVAGKLGILGTTLRGIGTALGLVTAKTTETKALTMALEENTAAMTGNAAASAKAAGGQAALAGAETATTATTETETVAVTELDAAQGASMPSGFLGKFGMKGMGSALASTVAGSKLGGLLGKTPVGGFFASRGAAAAGSAAEGMAPAELMAMGMAPMMTGALAGGAGIAGGAMIQQATGLRGGTAGTLGGGVVGAGLGAALGSVVPGVGTAIGAALGGAIGSSLGPTVGHLFGNLFGHEKAVNWGKQFASGFTSPFHDILQQNIGKSLAAAQQDNLAKTSNAIGNLQQQLNREQRPTAPMGRFGALGTPALPDQKQIQRDQARMNALYWRLGGQAGKLWVEAVQSTKTPTVWAFENDMIMSLQKLPPKARANAAQTMIEYAASLEHNGKLPKGATGKIVAEIERQFPALRAYLKDQGLQTDRDWMQAMQFKQARSTLGQTMQDIRTQFALFNVNPDVTGKNWSANVQTEMNSLRHIIATSTGGARDDAVNALQDLKTKSAANLTAMVTDTDNKMRNLRDAIANNSGDARTRAANDFYNIYYNVNWAMANGLISTQKGASMIKTSLDTVVKAYGGKPIPLDLKLEQLAAAKSAPAVVRGAASIAGGALHAASLGGATGALINVGVPGMPGHDSVPMNVGGTDIMVAPGEQVAVFNRHQAPIMNRALQREGYSGLRGFFQQEQRPNYLAEGGFVPGFDAGGYVYPLPPGTNIGRTDMGIDASMPPGSPIGPIGDAKILGINPGWYAGQPYMWWQLLSGPDAGKYVYLAEQITPIAGPGQVVKANQAVARFAPSGTGIEMGWGTASSATLAQSTSGYTEGQVTPAGASFRAFLTGLSHGQIVDVGGGGFAMITAPHVAGKGDVALMVQGALNKETDAANAWLAKQIAALSPGGGTFTGGAANAPVGNILQIAQQAFAQAGLPFVAYIVEELLSKESSGGVNEPPSGSLSATGPFQVIPSTFSSYDPGGSISNPADNALAAARYIKARYGSLEAMAQRTGLFGSGYVGYAGGGLAVMPGFAGGHPSLQMGQRRGSGSSRPLRRRPAAGKSTHTTGKHGPSPGRGHTGPKGTKGKQTKGKKTYVPKKLKWMKQFADLHPKLSADITTLANLDNALGELSTWQGFIQSRDGAAQVQPTITGSWDDPNDTTVHINWGDPNPSVPISQLTGLPDPATGDPTKGIWDRLREIGDPELTPTSSYTLPFIDYVLQGIHAGRGSPPIQTELGLDEVFAGAYAREQDVAANKVAPEFNQWYSQIQDQARQRKKRVDDLTGRIAFMTKRKERLAKEKSDADFRIQEHFRKLRLDLTVRNMRSTFSTQRLLTDQTLTMQKIREDALAALPAMRPPDLINADAQMGWSQAHQEERAAIYDRYTTDISRLRDQVAAMRLGREINRAQAAFALSHDEAFEKHSISDYYATLRTNLTDRLRNRKADLKVATTSYNNDTKAITAVTDPPGSSWLDSLRAYIDPMGQTSISLKTENDIQIPALYREISDLKGTPTQLAHQKTADTAGTSDSALLNLVEQQNQQLKLELMLGGPGGTGGVLGAVFAGLGDLLPPFGGSFALGGVVPGPLGEPRTIIAHGGEEVAPSGQGSRNDIRVRVEDHRVRVWHNDVEQIVHQTTSTAARHARRRLPGTSGGMGWGP